MKIERLLLILILVTVILRYLWAVSGWGGEMISLFPPLIFLFTLLVYYYLNISQMKYKITTLYFMGFVLSIFFNMMEWKGGGILLFIGSLGFIIFPVYFFLERYKRWNTNIFVFSLLLLMVLMVQTFLYIITPTNKLLTVGHMLSFLVVTLALFLLIKKELVQEINSDEKKMLTFIILVNVLSMLGITFKESFYIQIWI